MQKSFNSFLEMFKNTDNLGYPGFHGDIITQGIYNGLEGKAGDYKYVGSIGNRFFDNKLGWSKYQIKN